MLILTDWFAPVIFVRKKVQQGLQEAESFCFEIKIRTYSGYDSSISFALQN